MTPQASGFEPVAGCSSGAAYPGLVTRAWCACLARALGAWWPGAPGSAGLAGGLLGPTGPAGFPGAGGGGWAVAADDLGPVRVPRCGVPVGVQHQGPAEPVDHHLMVVMAQQDAIFETGFPALGQVHQMMHLTCRGRLGTPPGKLAMPVAEHDRSAYSRRDVRAIPDIQGQARAAQPRPQLP